MKLPTFVPIRTWNPTKVSSYTQCPLRTQLRYALHLCPLCFQGKVPFDGACDKCGKVPPKPGPMARGIEMDEEISSFLLDRMSTHPDRPRQFSHPKVNALIGQMADDIHPDGVKVKYQISLGPDWKRLPKYTKAPWFWGELDVLLLTGKSAKVIDWKSGGIINGGPDKGKIRESEEYQDQLEIYCIAVLCALEGVQRVDASLIFLDAAPPQDPEVKLKTGPVTRMKLDKLKKKWEGKIRPMFSDDVFGPRPGWYCDWCDYSKRKGGPCKF